MNYIIIGGTGFIGTHLTILIKQQYPDAQVYNLDIVKRYSITYRKKLCESTERRAGIAVCICRV